MKAVNLKNEKLKGVLNAIVVTRETESGLIRQLYDTYHAIHKGELIAESRGNYKNLKIRLSKNWCYDKKTKQHVKLFLKYYTDYDDFSWEKIYKDIKDGKIKIFDPGNEEK